MSGTGRVNVVIAGGGTGGHLYPGIAVARELLERMPHASITFAGTAAGLEARVVPREGFTLDLIRSGGLKGKSPAALARGLAVLPLSAADAWRILSRRQPRLVIGLGGFSSGPVVLLAALRRIPTLLLEQNAVPGFTNRVLSRVVDAAAVTYESSLTYFGDKGVLTGNPVRPEFFEAGAAARQGGGATRVLIFGGSQGARAINEAMVEAAPLLATASERLIFTHQTGERDLERVRAAYSKANVNARAEAFIYAMDRVITAADLVVCRAGATTLAEIAAAGRPAILVPLPTATDDHQRKNAEVLALAGAAEVVDQKELTGALLAERIVALAADEKRRRRMGEAAQRLATPDAARQIVDRALQLIGGQGRSDDERAVAADER
jgi:UDP-N-acetylglucosamine--N-acetylmuramyl-(pentapeptide) pyrophosphoryl-undecaprenol N-acetylglucosamine transferase